jgi:cysteine-rich repeat protein
MARLAVIVVLPLLCLGAACFDVALPETFAIACRDGRDCVDDTVCLLGNDVGAQRCVRRDSACIDVADREARALPDGSACSDERICVAASCVVPRCGDGVITAPEECDSGAGCRPDCVLPRCGDGVVDDAEDCDDGNVDSGDGCRADCGKVEVCGDGEVDVGEDCDDANGNPRDGCDGCQEQRWSSTLFVSGAVEPRAGPATALNNPIGVAVDPLGRVIVADVGNNRVRRVEVDGTLTTIAGAGTAGFSGDGGPATSAELDSPLGVAVDPFGRVIIADTLNSRVRRVEADGTITTVAGNGDAVDGSSGDGDPATSVALFRPAGVLVDPLGRLLIADLGDHRVLRVEVDGTITLLAGNGTAGFSGDGEPATSAALDGPTDLAVDALGRVLIADASNNCIRRVDVDGTITTIAGAGVAAFSGDGGPATSAALSRPSGVDVDVLGRVVIADTSNNRIRRVEPDGTIHTIGGTGAFDFSGDGEAATTATFNLPLGVAVDPGGRLLIADSSNNRIRRVELNGTIGTIAGTGTLGFAGDGGPATSAALSQPYGLVVDPEGWLVIADMYNHRIRRLEEDGTVTSVAGNGLLGFSGDGGPAARASLAFPQQVTFDPLGRLFIADAGNNRIRRVDVDGTITTIAGTGGAEFSGDGGRATRAVLNNPQSVAVDPLGRVLIADTFNNRIRRVDLDGTITTIAGNGDVAFSGDGPATRVALCEPQSLVVDAVGRVFFADACNHRVRRLELDGTITTLAGSGEGGVGIGNFSGDGGPATSAALNYPTGAAVDAAGRVFIADRGNHRIRLVDTSGTITTFAGRSVEFIEFAGDGGPATSAALPSPVAVVVDAVGRVVFVDLANNRIRRVELDGTLTTLAGPVNPAGPGPRMQARLYPSASLVSAPDATLFAVGGFGRALRVDVDAGVVDVVVGYDDDAPAVLGQARFAPLLQNARGVAFDPVALTLVITEQDTGDLRLIGLDANDDGAIDDASTWTNRAVTTDLVGPAGIAYDAGADDFVVVDERDHCVKRVDRDGGGVDVVFGRCGTAGVFPGFLSQPTQAVLSPTSGALYVADTGNHRVLRVDDAGVASLVIGDGSVSSAGEGSPARLFPVNAPRQLALDRFGNLYVASTTTVRLVENVDGDDDADGDDRVTTIFGGGARATFPESDTFCLHTVTVDDDDRVFAADACQGFMVELTPTLDP